MTRCALAWGFVALVTSLAAAAADTWAQQQERVAIVGRLAVIGGLNDPVNEAIRKGLRELGYVEGRDFRIEQRSAEGHIDQLPRAAEELVRLKADVIVTGTEISTRAARQATSTTPIVAIIPDEDPVVSGLIDFDAAFRTAKRQKAGAVMLLSSPQVYIRRAQLGTLALENKAEIRKPDLASPKPSFSARRKGGY